MSALLCICMIRWFRRVRLAPARRTLPLATVVAVQRFVSPSSRPGLLLIVMSFVFVCVSFVWCRCPSFRRVHTALPSVQAAALQIWHLSHGTGRDLLPMTNTAFTGSITARSFVAIFFWLASSWFALAVPLPELYFPGVRRCCKKVVQIVCLFFCFVFWCFLNLRIGIAWQCRHHPVKSKSTHCRASTTWKSLVLDCYWKVGAGSTGITLHTHSHALLAVQQAVASCNTRGVQTPLCELPPSIRWQLSFRGQESKFGNPYHKLCRASRKSTQK